MRGTTLVQDIAQSIVEYVDIAHAYGAWPGILNGEHERRVGRPLEPSRGDPETCVGRCDRGDRAVRGQRFDHTVDGEALREEQIAPSFETAIADATHQGEIAVTHDVTVGDRLHGNVRGGRNCVNGR